MAHEGIAGDGTGPGQDVEDAGWQAGIECGLSEQERRGRRDLRGLEDDGIAGREGRRHLLRLHREGGVPRRDGSHHAVGLVYRHRQVGAPRGIDLGAQCLAHARVVAEDAGGGERLGTAFRQHLPVVEHLRLRERLRPTLDEIGDGSQEPCAPMGKHLAPGRRVDGATRRLDGRVDVTCGRGADFVIDAAGGGIDRREHFAGIRNPLAADEQGPGLGGHGCRCVRQAGEYSGHVVSSARGVLAPVSLRSERHRRTAASRARERATPCAPPRVIQSASGGTPLEPAPARAAGRARPPRTV